MAKDNLEIVELKVHTNAFGAYCLYGSIDFGSTNYSIDLPTSVQCTSDNDGLLRLANLDERGVFSRPMRSGGLFRAEYTECRMKYRNWLKSSTQMIKICWRQVAIA